jgi:exodeoxyribonuclease-3
MSWNVNGIRAVHRHGFLDCLKAAAPDVLCVQETKATREQLDAELIEPPGYLSFWASAERQGYSGVAAYVKAAPLSITTLGVPEFDAEGRTQILEYPDVTIVNAYFPNSQEAGSRLAFKLRYCEALLAHCNALRAQRRHLLICGDFNIAHQPIDLKNPKANEKNAGYLPEERAWMSEFLAAGYVDTFRMFNQEAGHYTWWTYRFNARAKNIGWRIDYHCVNQEFASCVRASIILKDVMGSDHCPISIRFCPVPAAALSRVRSRPASRPSRAGRRR